MTDNLFTAIACSSDRKWLKECGDHNAKIGRKEVVEATKRQYGPREALIRTIRRGKKTEGLKLLAEHDRLDCAYEQIAIDYAHEMPEDVVEQARKTLEEFRGTATT